MPLPSTRSIEAFLAAVRLGSLAAAGAELGLSVPALSRRLATLERDLGVRLLDRLPRGVSPTPAGVVYHAHAQRALGQLRDAGEAVRRDGVVVRVTTIPAFATRWLLPKLPAFAKRHPGIAVDVRTSTVNERLADTDFDVAVRLARDDMMADEPFLPIHVMPVWSASGAAVACPEGLATRTLLGPDHRPEFWEEWLRDARMECLAKSVRGVDPLLLYELAITGTDVAIGIEPLVSDLLGSGRLEGLRSHRVRSSRSFFIVRRDPEPSRAVRLFVGWLREEAARSG